MAWFYPNSAVGKLVPCAGVSALQLLCAELIPEHLPGARGGGRQDVHRIISAGKD